VLKLGEVAAKGGPVNEESLPELIQLPSALHLVVQRTGGLLSDHTKRDALRQVA
jgi:hypothetical protein